MKTRYITIIGIMFLLMSTVSAGRNVESRWAYVGYGSGGTYKIYKVNTTFEDVDITLFDTIYSGSDIDSIPYYGVPYASHFYWSTTTTNQNFFRGNLTGSADARQMAGLNRSFNGMWGVDGKLFGANATHITSFDLPDLTVNLTGALDSCSSSYRLNTVLGNEYLIIGCSASGKYGFEGFHLSNLTRVYNANFTWSNNTLPEDVVSVDADANYVYAVVKDTNDLGIHLIASDTSGNIVDSNRLNDMGFNYGYPAQLKVIGSKIYVVGTHTDTSMYIASFDKQLDVLANETYGAGTNMQIGNIDTDYNQYIYITVIVGTGSSQGLYIYDFSDDTMEKQYANNDLNTVHIASHSGATTSGQELKDFKLTAYLNEFTVDTADVVCTLSDNQSVDYGWKATNGTGVMYWENLANLDYNVLCVLDESLTVGTIKPENPQTLNFTSLPLGGNPIVRDIKWTDGGDTNTQMVMNFDLRLLNENTPVENVSIDLYLTANVNQENGGLAQTNTLKTNSLGKATVNLTKNTRYYYNASLFDYTCPSMLDGNNNFFTDENPDEKLIFMVKDEAFSQTGCYLEGYATYTDGSLVETGVISVLEKSPLDFIHTPKQAFITNGFYNISTKLGYDYIIAYDSQQGKQIISYVVDTPRCSLQKNVTVEKYALYDLYVYMRIEGVNVPSTEHKVYVYNYSTYYDTYEGAELNTTTSKAFKKIKLIEGQEYTLNAVKSGFQNASTTFTAVNTTQQPDRTIELVMVKEEPDGITNCFLDLKFKSTDLYNATDEYGETEFGYKLYSTTTGRPSSKGDKLKTSHIILKQTGVWSYGRKVACGVDYEVIITDSDEYKISDGFGDGLTVTQTVSSTGYEKDTVYLEPLPRRSIAQRIKAFDDNIVKVLPYFFWLSVVVIIMFFGSSIVRFGRDVL